MFPLPTEAVGLRRLWLWSLPVRAITLLSLFTFLLTVLGLSATRELRALFHLPGPAWLLATAAAGLAALAAWSGRKRPGRLLPRLWPLALGSGAALLALTTRAPSLQDQPILHALVTAFIASAMVLALRLPRPSVTGLWNERCVLAATLLAALQLTAGLPLAARAARASWHAEISAAIAELDTTAREARLTARTVQGDEAGFWQAAETRLGALSRRHPAGFLRREQLWRAAAVLGRERELAGAAQRALTDVGEALASEQAPSLGQLAWPSLWFDRDRKVWIEDPRFEGRSRVVERHYRELARLLSELRPLRAGLTDPASVALSARFESAWSHWAHRLTELQASWSDGWVVDRLIGGRELAGGESATLAELLGQPVFKAGRRPFRPVEIWSLMGLSGRDAWPIGGEPGCLRHRYTEEGTALFRADCFAYRPRHGGEGAELAIEVRLVYRTVSLLLDFDRERPHEVYFLFPLPAGGDADAYQAEVMEAFAGAVEIAHPHFGFAEDRSGTAMKGFRLTDGWRRLRVHSRAIPFAYGRQAVEVRAFWE